ncbi:MAG: hypothetical protein MMC23_009942 [Stictis urceolatum]|nr:hypothetical protein [Stictis urceolata]
MLLAHTSNAQSLQSAQTALPFLNSHPQPKHFPLSLLAGGETTEQWRSFETIFVACLKSGDDKAAHLLLERLIERFGQSNERVMGLRALYQEAAAGDTGKLEDVLSEYESIMVNNPTNVSIAKRRVALLKSLSRQTEAIKALVAISDVYPTDAEVWAELSDSYLALGMYSQATYCLEEVLLIAPNAWNIHAKMGEMLYMSVASESGHPPNEADKILHASLDRYCRSIELCDNYIRGLCGLKIVCDEILELVINSKANQLPDGSIEQIHRLSSKAALKISNIISTSSADPETPDLIAAKALLNRKKELAK